MQWGIYELDEIHVAPIGDMRSHEFSGACWCDPIIDDGLVIHNSADGREVYERGERLPN